MMNIHSLKQSARKGNYLKMIFQTEVANATKRYQQIKGYYTIKLFKNPVAIEEELPANDEASPI